jgi:hypothetical protein
MTLQARTVIRMSARGFFAIDRGVWDHPLFAREKFSEREAWFWLISSAAWENLNSIKWGMLRARRSQRFAGY